MAKKNMLDAKKVGELLARKLVLCNPYFSCSNITATLPREACGDGITENIQFFGEHTKELLRIVATAQRASKAHEIKVGNLTMVSAVAQNIISDDVRKAAESMEEYVNSSILPNMPALKANYEARVKEELKIRNLSVEDEKKAYAAMMRKWPAGGPSYQFCVDFYDFPTSSGANDSQERLNAAAFKQLIGGMLKRMGDITTAAERRLESSADVHGATLTAAKKAYVQLAEEVADINLPALTDALDAFKVVMVDNADDIGASIGLAYMHFLNANMYATAVQFDCHDQMSNMAAALGGHDALLEAAESLPLAEMMKLVGGEQ